MIDAKYFTGASFREFDKSQVPLPQESSKIVWPQCEFVDLEIGCGNGFHPIQYAKNNPERTLIAIERTQERFSKFKKRVDTNKVGSNLIPVRANAINWCTHYLKEKCLDKIFILYPNPSPRNRSDRWACMPFMGHLLKALKDNGELIMASNESAYIEEAKLQFQEIWKSSSVYIDEVKPDQNYRTQFEKKFIENSQKCFNLVVRK